MNFQTKKASKGKIVVIECPEQIDINISPDLKSLLKQLVEDKQFRIVFDLSKTKYMDSSGLGAIVSRIADARNNNGDLIISGARDNIVSLLNLTHLDKILTILPDLKSAINHFES